MTGRFVAYHAGLAFGGEGGIRTLIESFILARLFDSDTLLTLFYVN